MKIKILVLLIAGIISFTTFFSRVAIATGVNVGGK